MSLLGFDAQLVFSTFAGTQFAGGEHAAPGPVDAIT